MFFFFSVIAPPISKDPSECGDLSQTCNTRQNSVNLSVNLSSDSNPSQQSQQTENVVETPVVRYP